MRMLGLYENPSLCNTVREMVGKQRKGEINTSERAIEEKGKQAVTRTCDVT